MSADQAVPPSGVVTFLFTDVEGSTRRWEADAAEMRAALAADDQCCVGRLRRMGAGCSSTPVTV
jgi:class 3 adenylate cyclase